MGEVGEIWDPPGPYPMSVHSLWNRGIPWPRPALAGLPPSWTPIIGAALTLWHPLFRNGFFFSFLIASESSGLLHKHSVARQPSSLFSSWIPGNSVQANSLECPYSWYCPLSQLFSLAPFFGEPSSICLVHLIFLIKFRDQV